MSRYLTRIEVGSVENVDQEGTTQYMKRVHVVEVVDQDGQPWEPVPGPDPFDELVVAYKATWSASNVYRPGETISGTSATFVGGSDNVTYRSRVQYKVPGSNSWVNTTWTDHNNSPQLVSFTLGEDFWGYEVRFMTQARDTSVDPVEQVNSFASTQQVDFADLVVGTPTVTGLPYVGQTVVCSQPTVTGGAAPYSYTYTWKLVQAPTEGAWNTGSTVVIPQAVVGQTGFCEVTVEDAVGTTEVVNSGHLGPILSPPVMAPTVTKLNGDVVAQDEVHEVPAGTHNLQVVLNQTPNDVQFFWSLRSGTGTLTPDPILVDHATYTIGTGDFAPIIAVTVESDISENTAASWSLISI